MFRIVAKRHFHAANLQKIIEKQNTSAVYLTQTRIFCQTQRHIINVSPSASPFECSLPRHAKPTLMGRGTWDNGTQKAE